MFPDFADVSRGPGKKDDRNREEERRGKGSEQRVVDGGIGWLEAVTDTVEQEMKEEDLRGWTCKAAEGVSFFRFYRKERVAPSP